jgi:hypothetical protein
MLFKRVKKKVPHVFSLALGPKIWILGEQIARPKEMVFSMSARRLPGRKLPSRIPQCSKFPNRWRINWLPVPR